jgi:hypothetical protein
MWPEIAWRSRLGKCARMDCNHRHCEKQISAAVTNACIQLKYLKFARIVTFIVARFAQPMGKDGFATRGGTRTVLSLK